MVSMLGECNWVRNVRAAHGDIVLKGRDGGPAHLTEVDVSERPAILKNYVQQVPGARPHVAVDRSALVSAFAAIAAAHPVFQVESAR